MEKVNEAFGEKELTSTSASQQADFTQWTLGNEVNLSPTFNSEFCNING